MAKVTEIVRGMDTNRERDQFDRYCKSVTMVKHESEGSSLLQIVIQAFATYHKDREDFSYMLRKFVEYFTRYFKDNPRRCLHLLKQHPIQTIDEKGAVVTLTSQPPNGSQMLYLLDFLKLICRACLCTERSSRLSVIDDLRRVHFKFSIADVVVQCLLYLLGDDAVVLHGLRFWDIACIAFKVKHDNIKWSIYQFLWVFWKLNVDLRIFNIHETGFYKFTDNNHFVWTKPCIELDDITKLSPKELKDFRKTLQKSESFQQTFIKCYSVDTFRRIAQSHMWGLLVIIADEQFAHDNKWVYYFTDLGEVQIPSELEKRLILPSTGHSVKFMAHDSLSPPGCVYLIQAQPKNKKDLLLIIKEFCSSSLLQYCEVVFGGHGEEGSGNWILGSEKITFDEVIPLLRIYSPLYLNCCYSHIWSQMFSKRYKDKSNIIRPSSSNENPLVPLYLLSESHALVTLHRVKKQMDSIWYKALVHEMRTGSNPGLLPKQIEAPHYKYPRGFESFDHFARCLTPLLNWLHKKTHDKKDTVVIHGSSIQGFRFRCKGEGKFWFGEDSDYDVALCSKMLFDEATKQGIKIYGDGPPHTRPLTEDDDLYIEIQSILQILEWPRKVNCMVYASSDDAQHHSGASLVVSAVEFDEKLEIMTWVTGEVPSELKEFVRTDLMLPHMVQE